jgi:hypothetical protein
MIRKDDPGVVISSIKPALKDFDRIINCATIEPLTL